MLFDYQKKSLPFMELEVLFLCPQQPTTRPLTEKLTFLERASRSGLMKYIIKSLIYFGTTNIYWSIQATCFDLLTGPLQAIN